MQFGVDLINEAQVAMRLAQAVKCGRRPDFALILAMLTQDARDFAQFCIDTETSEEKKLERQFELPPRQSLLANLATAAFSDNSETFWKSGKRAFELRQALAPEPLVIRGNEPTDMAIALSNCDIHVKRRYQSNSQPSFPALPHFADCLVAQRDMAKLMVQA